ncbi:low molecular weight phosphatase family protein [Nonlabens xiamenensis]|uniref:hypothetical protein n=1 Tax=Nonlabens xiamenensis TaxID=2341043 RepID=UPI000F606977|nr:hypothetical protein [Nonlabens xiamenensis]
MASAFLQYYSPKKTKVVGIGLEPRELHHMAKKVMDSIGIAPLKETYQLDQLKEVTFDFVLTFSDKAKSYAQNNIKGKQFFHLEMDGLDQTTEDAKESKKAFKSARKELQQYCADFVETHLDKKVKTATKAK